MAGLELRKLTIGREAANDARGFFNFNGTSGSMDSGIRVQAMARPICVRPGPVGHDSGFPNQGIDW